MGQLVEGVWRDERLVAQHSDGRFVRSETRFRNWVTADGSPGPTGAGGFAAAPGRYHLYVSLACPWAHRTLIFRKLKKLEDLVSVSVVDPVMLSNGSPPLVGTRSRPIASRSSAAPASSATSHTRSR